MGSLQVVLADRFNEQLREIYRRGLRFILTQLGKEFDNLLVHVPPNENKSAIKASRAFSVEEIPLSIKGGLILDFHLEKELANHKKAASALNSAATKEMETSFEKLKNYASHYEKREQND